MSRRRPGKSTLRISYPEHVQENERKMSCRLKLRSFVPNSLDAVVITKAPKCVDKYGYKETVRKKHLVTSSRKKKKKRKGKVRF